MQSIIISLKNGHTVKFPDCIQSDFENLAKSMKGMKDHFIWHETTWIRKEDISCFAIVEEIQNSPIPQ